ncbi:MAG: hypothetical protein ABIJ03_02845 [Patescibacteria group bacterium]
MRYAVFLVGVVVWFWLMVGQVSANQLVSVECQDKTCWTSQSIRSDIKLSLVPGQSILETWQVKNDASQTVRVLIKVTDKLSQTWADQPLQLAINGQELELDTWQEVELLHQDKTTDVNLQIRLDPRADNFWQNHTWQLAVELVAEPQDLELIGQTGQEIEVVSVLAEGKNDKVLGTGLAPESIKSNLNLLNSPWQFALVGVLVPLFLILMAHWFVKSRQSIDD